MSACFNLLFFSSDLFKRLCMTVLIAFTGVAMVAMMPSPWQMIPSGLILLLSVGSLVYFVRMIWAPDEFRCGVGLFLLLVSINLCLFASFAYCLPHIYRFSDVGLQNGSSALTTYMWVIATGPYYVYIYRRGTEAARSSRKQETPAPSACQSA